MNQFLECQTCGKELKELSLAEQQQVADKPYNYIVYCKDCRVIEIELCMRIM